jgi:transposase
VINPELVTFTGPPTPPVGGSELDQRVEPKLGSLVFDHGGLERDGERRRERRSGICATWEEFAPEAGRADGARVAADRQQQQSGALQGRAAAGTAQRLPHQAGWPNYAPRMGRPSIAPEKLLRAMLLQAFYSIRSERQLMERIEYDLLFRWFVGLGVDDPAWDHSSFSANRDRLLAGEIAAKFLGAVLAQPRVKRLLSSDHFSVDGTLIEAWASMKSFRPKSPSSGEDPRNGSGEPPLGGGRNAEANFRGEKRSNGTHESTSDPQARLYRKGDGQPAILCYMARCLSSRARVLTAALSRSLPKALAAR